MRIEAHIMKTIHNNSYFFDNLTNIGLIFAIILALPCDNLLYSPFNLAQSLPSSSRLQQSINGLYTPTNSERFFEQGRKQLEEEIKRLNQPQTDTEDLLNIDQDVLKQKQLLEKQQWLLDSQESQNFQQIS